MNLTPEEQLRAVEMDLRYAKEGDSLNARVVLEPKSPHVQGRMLAQRLNTKDDWERYQKHLLEKANRFKRELCDCNECTREREVRRAQAALAKQHPLSA